MTLSLRERLFVGSAIAISLSLVVLVGFMARQQTLWLLEREQSTLTLLARIASSELGPNGEWRDLEPPTAADSLGARLGCRVTLIARDGRVLGDSQVPHTSLATLENHATRPEVRAALAGRSRWSLRPSATLHVRELYVAIPVAERGLAVVRVARSLKEVQQLGGSLFFGSLVGVALALLFGLIVAFRVASRGAARVAALEAATVRLGAGDASARALERPEDDLGRLGRAINEMADQLRSRIVALQRDRDERETILGHMSDGVALIDSEGRLVRANRRLGDLLDHPLPETGVPFREIARWPEFDDLLAAVRRERRTVEHEVRLWTPVERHLRATATPLAGADGTGVLLVLHDLTDAEELHRVRQDFVANVSHELRTPLTSMRGYAETLLDGGLDDVEHREGFVRIIRDQTERLQALVDDLLSLSELERAGAELRVTRFDLREPIDRQIAAFRERAARVPLALEFEPGPVIEVEADRSRIEQVIANLLDNAIKYTERGSVRVRVGADAALAWCEVEDTGPGIPEVDQPRVFERFYRVEKARSRDHGGTGLGLSIVKHIVALHLGEVSLESNMGEGSRFRFEIPRRAARNGA